MTVTNAAKGLRHVMQHREKLIEDLDTMTKDWKDDCAKGMIDAIKDFMTRDLGSFEWILEEIQRKKIIKVSHNKKRK